MADHSMETAEMRCRPMDGIRIIDLSQVFAMPYAAGLLADLGAEVIKVEAPRRMDQTRGYGGLPENTPGDDPWNRTGTFHTLNRNKRSLILDLSQDVGREIFLRLVKDSDIVIEAFTPRVMRGWNLDYESLSQVRPDLIMLSNTGYGSTGPWSGFPTQGTTLEATMGICAYTGYRAGPPAKVGQSYPDFLAAWTGLYTLLAALHYREKTGCGQHIELAMYQLGVAMIPEPILQYQIDCTDPGRIGNGHETMAPYNIYPTMGEHEWIAICVRSDEEWTRFTKAMDVPKISDPKFRDSASRLLYKDELDLCIAESTRWRDSRILTALLQKSGVAAGPIMNARDLLLDPHLKSRGFFRYVAHPGTDDPRPIIGHPYKITSVDTSTSHCGPLFGQDNTYILRDLVGLSGEEIDALYAAGTVSNDPIDPRKATSSDFDAGLRAGTLKHVDAEYREKLALFRH